MVTPNNVKIAKEFVARFCSGDIEGLDELLQEDLNFQGPLFQFASRSEYLESLRNDPPDMCNCNILSITENADDVSLYYEYGKDEGCLTIAQLFRFKNNKIAEILLVFDSKGFVQKKSRIYKWEHCILDRKYNID